ncbi:MAG: class I SAM-dependent methyltransferase [Oleiphilaceae bacterium]|nr:class I SAM-dependent methyltransferase [Oleiphilaceae bacterium]
MDPAHWLDPAEEKAVYDLHDNDAGDPGYRRFLNKLAEPLLARVPKGARGLDFGCGPGPVLAGMLADSGLAMTLYDPIYFPDPEALTHTYDFITCTEVAEHLYDPRGTFAQLGRCLKPGGWLGVMTCFQTDDARFANWHYRRDPTHVVFYRQATLAWLARTMGWHLEVPVKDVALFRALNPAGGGRLP